MTCGCNDVACGCNVTDTDTVAFTGDGSSGDPFAAAVIADPLGGLESGTDGVAIVIDPASTAPATVGVDGLRIDCCGDAEVPQARVSRMAALEQTTSGFFEAVEWDTENFDNDGMFTAPDTVLTIQTAGLYICTAVVGIGEDLGGTTYIEGAYHVNGSVVHWARTVLDPHEVTVSIVLSTLLRLAVADELDVRVFQDRGANLDFLPGAATMNLAVARISA